MAELAVTEKITWTSKRRHLDVNVRILVTRVDGHQFYLFIYLYKKKYQKLYEGESSEDGDVEKSSLQKVLRASRQTFCTPTRV